KKPVEEKRPVEERKPTEEKKPAEEKKPVATLPAQSLYVEYVKDLAAADLKYLDKTVFLTDLTGKVQKDAEGRYFIAGDVSGERTSGRGSNIPGQRVIPAPRPGLVLYISKDDLAAFTGIDRKAISVRGLCRGTRADQDGVPRFVVVLENCRAIAK